MPSWKDEYLSSLKTADLSHPVNMELVQICSHMADRISALEAEKSVLLANRTTTTAASRPQASSPSPNPSASDDAAVSQIRLELAEALRSKGIAETRLRTAEEELDLSRTNAKRNTKAIHDLTNGSTTLSRKLKDKEYELEQKKKLISDVQDEMISLELQLSLAEKERDRVKKENTELVDRWMKRMAKEADAMNLTNER